MEITVVLPDAFAASDLTWHLTAWAQIGEVAATGRYVVTVSAGENIKHLLGQIRDWAKLNRIDGITVHVRDETDSSLRVGDVSEGLRLT